MFALECFVSLNLLKIGLIGHSWIESDGGGLSWARSGDRLG